MSEKFKLKYEVIAILRDNIIMGMNAFGLPISESPGDGGWIVMESDQPSLRNVDKAVLFCHEKTERIAYGRSMQYVSEQHEFEDEDNFLEQQDWKIKVIRRRLTTPVTDEDIPITTEDVAGMLAAWFHRQGCMEFRKHNMSCLYVLMKDLRTYKDPSDVNQWVTEFVLKLHVNKAFYVTVTEATPEYKGAVPISGYSGRRGKKPNTLGLEKGLIGAIHLPDRLY